MVDDSTTRPAVLAANTDPDSADRPNRRKTPRVDNLTLATVFGSLALGAIVGFLAKPIDGVIIGLLCACLSELLQLSYRSRRSSDLYAMSRRIDWLPGVLEELVGVASELATKGRSEILVGELREYLEALLLQAQDLERGVIVRSSSNFSDLMGETRRCQEKIEAVTNVTSERIRRGTSWWHRPQGREYWKQNVALLQGGGRTITRVFVIDRLDAHTKDIMTEQHKAGVDVRFILSKDLHSEFQINLAIWDGGVAWRASMSALGTIIENQLLLEPTDVRRVKRVYETCLAESEVFHPDIAVEEDVSSLSAPETANAPTPKDAQAIENAATKPSEKE